MKTFSVTATVFLALLPAILATFAGNQPVFAAENIALDKYAWSNSEYPDYGASKAVDGDRATNWSASGWAGPANPLWLKIDLGQLYDISRIDLMSRDIWYDSSYGVNYNFYASADNTKWSRLDSGWLMDDAASYSKTLSFGAGELTGRYLWFEVVGGKHWAHLYELEAYGTASVTPEPLSAGLFLIGGGALAIARRRKNK